MKRRCSGGGVTASVLVSHSASVTGLGDFLKFLKFVK